MKKLLLVAAAGFMIAGMSSCKKDYTCTCTTPEQDLGLFGTVPASSSTVTFENVKEDDAKTTCDAGTGSGVTCVLAEK
ncbi:hypothetical protein N9F17_00890 [Salibacteraceae bacterium]|nr:hypothetical protein [Salibacteraceae bacterium]